jgi:1-deoxy-D-xylulose-5-phosphate synthase
MLETGVALDQPAAVRYPRGRGPGVEVDATSQPLPLGKGEIRREGRDVALLVFGSLLDDALQAAGDLDATVANMRFVKPLDEALVRELTLNHRLLVSIEDNAVAGGAGSAVGEFLAQAGLSTPLVRMGIPDRFLDQASRPEQLAECGLDAAGIRDQVRQALASRIAKIRAVE